MCDLNNLYRMYYNKQKTKEELEEDKRIEEISFMAGELAGRLCYLASKKGVRTTGNIAQHQFADCKTFGNLVKKLSYWFVRVNSLIDFNDKKFNEKYSEILEFAIGREDKKISDNDFSLGMIEFTLSL